MWRVTRSTRATRPPQPRRDRSMKDCTRTCRLRVNWGGDRKKTVAKPWESLRQVAETRQNGWRQGKKRVWRGGDKGRQNRGGCYQANSNPGTSSREGKKCKNGNRWLCRRLRASCRISKYQALLRGGNRSAKTKVWDGVRKGQRKATPDGIAIANAWKWGEFSKSPAADIESAPSPRYTTHNKKPFSAG